MIHIEKFDSPNWNSKATILFCFILQKYSTLNLSKVILSVAYPSPIKVSRSKVKDYDHLIQYIHPGLRTIRGVCLLPKEHKNKATAIDEEANAGNVK